MKALLAFLSFCLLLLGTLNAASKTTTSQKIATNEKTLATNQDLEKRLNKKLDELARDIVRRQEELQITQNQIKNMQIQVAELESSAKAASSELNTLVSQNSKLIKSQRELEEKMLKAISEEFAYDLVVPKSYTESEESIIANEVLVHLNASVSAEVTKMAKDYSKTANLIKTQSNRISTIEFDLKEFRAKQEKLKELSIKQNKELAQLRNDKDAYSRQLEDLSAQQLELRKTLENLRIIAKDEKAKQEVKQQSEQIKAAAKASKDATTSFVQAPSDVRQVGSSYQGSLVKRYKGDKTIAPLEQYTLKQAFGAYTDPIYKIKIFNESVVLRSITPDATVKNVLDGKVVFAKDTAMLDKVIIMENADGIHTIYAHLSKIAPTIKVGTRIKKGYVIGRVERDLTFEVTQKNYHINPMELIASK